MFKLSILVTMFLTLAGCVVPFGKSNGPDDSRAPYFFNAGSRDEPLRQSEQLTAAPSLRLR